MTAQAFHCPNCGGPLDVANITSATIRCPFCGTSVMIPRTMRLQNAAAEAGGSQSSANKVVISLGDYSSSSQAQPQPSIRVKSSRRLGAWLTCLVLLITAGIAISFLIPTVAALFVGGAAVASIPKGILPTKTNPATVATQGFSFGGKGIGPGLFEDPRGIAVDGEGYIYVMEYSNGRVQRFNPQGNYVSEWTLGKVYLGGMDASRDGIVWVAYGGEIWQYEGETGKFLGKFEYAEDHYFDDLALTSDGGLAVISNGDDLIRFDSQGQALFNVEDAVSNQTGKSELDARIAVDGLGFIYIIGRFNEYVFKYDPEGKFVTRISGPGSEIGLLNSPLAIEIDGYGRIFVSDGIEIKVFDPNGRFIEAIKTSNAAFGLDMDFKNQLFAVMNAPLVAMYTLLTP